MELKEARGLQHELETILINLEEKKELFDVEQLYDLQNKRLIISLCEITNRLKAA